MDQARIRDLLQQQQERLELEFKGWLELGRDRDHDAVLAKAALALANHGGGAIAIGFDNDHQPDVAGAPPDPRTRYRTDAVHAANMRYATPQFEVDCRFELLPGSATEHPVLVIPGGHAVPIVPRRASPDERTIVQGRVYIRRPGPKSEEPQTADEWRELLDRCIANRQEQLVSLLRPVAERAEPAAAVTTQTSTAPELRERTVQDRMSDMPAPAARGATGPADLVDPLTEDERFVLGHEISEERVQEIRDKVYDFVENETVHRLFTSAGTHVREEVHRPGFTFAFNQLADLLEMGGQQLRFEVLDHHPRSPHWPEPLWS